MRRGAGKKTVETRTGLFPSFFFFSFFFSPSFPLYFVFIMYEVSQKSNHYFILTLICLIWYYFRQLAQSLNLLNSHMENSARWREALSVCLSASVSALAAVCVRVSVRPPWWIFSWSTANINVCLIYWPLRLEDHFRWEAVSDTPRNPDSSLAMSLRGFSHKASSGEQ